ncbi:SirB2 family protein [Spirabiliibacterium falconis]|uniref:SirB2 family protein n=1 Tax=Spirabiliibacterium falconis TaxID=572023 RepID=UPI001AACAF67|nr:SirB2 family protein [Spirabiliibacterium falconis]MBE2894205.1 SirB2 family protein [Spirabiliibacterium falconis]
MSFSTLLLGHITFAFFALALLLIRGIMQLRGLNWRSIIVLRIMPHIIDTLLLLSGIMMIVLGYPMMPWLWCKIALLLGYIMFSIQTFKRNMPKNSCFLPALFCLLAVMGIAYFH